MKHEPGKYLADMLERCSYLVTLASKHTIAEYRKDRMLRNTIERERQNIGEALMQLNRRKPGIARKITEHDRIIRFRHVLVHGYDIVRADYVWDVLTLKLPILKRELETLLDQRSLFSE